MRKVEVTEIVNTSSERIIRAFIEPVMLRGWWGVERAGSSPSRSRFGEARAGALFYSNNIFM